MHIPGAQTHWNEGVVMYYYYNYYYYYYYYYKKLDLRWVLTMMYNTQHHWIYELKTRNLVALFRVQTVPIEQPQLVGKVSATFCG
jgi:hypothetical protein